MTKRENQESVRLKEKTDEEEEEGTFLSAGIGALRRAILPRQWDSWDQINRRGTMVKYFAGFLLLLNFCISVIVCAIAGWALNKAIDHPIITGPGGPLPMEFSVIHFSLGNGATRFFIIFALIAGAVGAGSALSGLYHLRVWTTDSLAADATSSMTAWPLNLLAMGLASKEIHLHGRNSKLTALESFVIILSGTQLFYALLIHAVLFGVNYFPWYPTEKQRCSTTTVAHLNSGRTSVNSAV